jgi:hypothetical protein
MVGLFAVKVATFPQGQSGYQKGTLDKMDHLGRSSFLSVFLFKYLSGDYSDRGGKAIDGLFKKKMIE